MKFEVGDIILYESGTWIGNKIAKVTNYPYSHVALAVSENEVVEANAFIKSRLVNFSDTKYKKVLILRARDGLTSEQKRTLVKECGSLLDRGYDYYGIFVLMIKYITGFDLTYAHNTINRLWCSELVDFVYDKIGLDLAPNASFNTVSIEDIANSDELVSVGEIYRPLETIVDDNKPFGA